jgi:hypothetical protein
MKLYKCQICEQVLYFENMRCERCQHRLGYLPGRNILTAAEPEDEHWIAAAEPAARFRFCKNWEQGVCNWMVDAGDEEEFCLCCRHNRTIPDIAVPENRQRWQKIEEAKRRLFYTLIKLKLPCPTLKSGDPEPLVFDFLADVPGSGTKVLTGHDEGVITIALAEADDAERERRRASMREPYRTLLGHFRHEVGHYYWDKLVRDTGKLESFRALFGDDSEDYAAALQRHYEEGAPANWRENFVSAYATMHAWEDWAETWAHYLHIVDTLEMASAFGITIKPEVAEGPELAAEIDFDPHRVRRIQTLVDAWLPLTYAANSLNRSMGLPDLYPFVLSPRAIEKLGYVHRLVHAKR